MAQAVLRRERRTGDRRFPGRGRQIKCRYVQRHAGQQLVCALLNATGRAYVSKTGTTQFRLRFATGDNDNNVADYMKFFSGDTATASARPTLIIEYYIIP